MEAKATMDRSREVVRKYRFVINKRKYDPRKELSLRMAILRQKMLAIESLRKEERARQLAQWAAENAESGKMSSDEVKSRQDRALKLQEDLDHLNEEKHGLFVLLKQVLMADEKRKEAEAERERERERELERQRQAQQQQQQQQQHMGGGGMDMGGGGRMGGGGGYGYGRDGGGYHHGGYGRDMGGMRQSRFSGPPIPINSPNTHLGARMDPGLSPRISSSAPPPRSSYGGGGGMAPLAMGAASGAPHTPQQSQHLPPSPSHMAMSAQSLPPTQHLPSSVVASSSQPSASSAPPPPSQSSAAAAAAGGGGVERGGSGSGYMQPSPRADGRMWREGGGGGGHQRGGGGGYGDDHYNSSYSSQAPLRGPPSPHYGYRDGRGGGPPPGSYSSNSRGAPSSTGGPPPPPGVYNRGRPNDRWNSYRDHSPR